MAPNEDWLVWQLADSAFPTGGFAHSGGLEAAWQHGEVRGGAELAGFIESSLTQLGHAALPFVTTAYLEPPRLAELDRLCDAFLSNHVANRASRLQGQALLATSERSFPSPALKDLRTSIRSQSLPGHLAPLFGAITRLLGLSRESATRLFFFIHLRGFISSAVRLNIIGPLEAQSLQHRLSATAENIAQRCAGISLGDIAQTSPLLDIFQGAQDRLYSRLFQS